MTCCATVQDARALCCRPATSELARPVTKDWARWIDWMTITLLGVSVGLAGAWSLVSSL